MMINVDEKTYASIKTAMMNKENIIIKVDGFERVYNFQHILYIDFRK